MGDSVLQSKLCSVTNLSFTLDIFIHPGRNVYESQFLLENFFFFNALLCVYLQPADLQDLGAVGRVLRISAATAKAVKSH